uniref:Zona pellucida glycoprotein 1 n=1 Tax=Apteryx owenii TaxID=8824 RepID=A0A8B9NVZ9_APTOW
MGWGWSRYLVALLLLLSPGPGIAFSLLQYRYDCGDYGMQLLAYPTRGRTVRFKVLDEFGTLFEVANCSICLHWLNTGVDGGVIFSSGYEGCHVLVKEDHYILRVRMEEVLISGVIAASYEVNMTCPQTADYSILVDGNMRVEHQGNGIHQTQAGVLVPLPQPQPGLLHHVSQSALALPGHQLPLQTHSDQVHSVAQPHPGLVHPGLQRQPQPSLIRAGVQTQPGQVRPGVQTQSGIVRPGVQAQPPPGLVHPGVQTQHGPARPGVQPQSQPGLVRPLARPQPGLRPGIQSPAQPGLLHPGVQTQPGLVHPGFQPQSQPGLVRFQPQSQPGLSQPGLVHPGLQSQSQPGLVHPGLQSQSQPGLVHPGLQSQPQPGLVRPGIQPQTQPGLARPGLQTHSQAGLIHSGVQTQTGLAHHGLQSQSQPSRVHPGVQTQAGLARPGQSRPSLARPGLHPQSRPGLARPALQPQTQPGLVRPGFHPQAQPGLLRPGLHPQPGLLRPTALFYPSAGAGIHGPANGEGRRGTARCRVFSAPGAAPVVTALRECSGRPPGSTVQCLLDGHFIIVVPRGLSTQPYNLDSVRLANAEAHCDPVKVTEAFVMFRFPVTQCGTTVQVIEDRLIYENQLISTIDVQSGPQGSITRDSVYILHARCIYNASDLLPVRVEVAVPPTAAPLVEPGPLRLQLRIATDESYSTYHEDSDYPLVKVLRDPIYVEVRLLQKTDPNLVLVLHQCWASPSTSATAEPQWPILVDGCPFVGDNYRTQLVPMGPASPQLPFPSHYQRFVVSTFTFVESPSMAMLEGEVYIFCSASVCHLAQPEPCRPSCQLGVPSRARRSLGDKMTPDPMDTVISQGRIVFQESPQVQKG